MYLTVSKGDFLTLITVDCSKGSVMLWDIFAKKYKSQISSVERFYGHMMTKIDLIVLPGSILKGEVFSLNSFLPIVKHNGGSIML